MKTQLEIEQIMIERFGTDSIIALATTVDNVPFVRNVDAFYENGSFYILTHAFSTKMKQIEKNNLVAISGEWFMHMSHKFEVERFELKGKIVTLKQQLNDLTEQKRSADQFIAMVRKFSEIETLTAPFLKELIDHIDVYETEGVGKNRTQRLKIYYNFVGYIEIPENLDNYVADTRQGVAVEYLTRTA